MRVRAGDGARDWQAATAGQGIPQTRCASPGGPPALPALRASCLIVRAPHGTRDQEADMAPLPPTSKQMKLLRRLAEERGMTFVVPDSRQQASQQIDRLKRRSRQTRNQRAWDQHVADTARVLTDAAAVRRSEITGFGSSAHWAGHS